MSEFLMTTWAGAGTGPPLMSVARSLTERGHDVRVLCDALLRPDVEVAGADHISWTRAPQRTRHGREGDFIRDWEPTEPGGDFARMRDRLAVGPARLHATDVRAEIERSRPAAVLSELFLFGSLVAAEAAGVPAIVLNPTINVVPAPGVPPFGQGFLPARNPEEEARDREFGALVVAAWDEALPALNQARAEQGLAPVEHVLDQGQSAARVLVLTSRAFDFSGPLPASVKHVGPRLEDPAWASAWDPPAGEHPLVLVALSSDYQGQSELLQRTVDALRSLPVRGIVTTGQGIDPAGVEAPENVAVVRAAPHMEVLRDAALVVTHGGHGTVIKALAAGVPLVCLPMGRDQFDVTARVIHAGAGRRLDRLAQPADIAATIRKTIDDPGCRAAATRIASAIAEETANDLAVAEIESVVADAERRAVAVG
jgi:MGT family glycosyltransferase